MKKIILLIGVAVLLTAAGVISGRGDTRSAHTQSDEAYAAYARGNEQLTSLQLQNAEASLRRAIALDPGFAMAHAALAQLLARQQKKEEVKAEIAIADSLAATMKQDLARLQVQVRLSAIDKSRYQASADSLLDAGKALDPDEVIFLVVEAILADADRDAEKAERIWNHVLAVDPNYAEAYNSLGYFYLAQGRYSEAEEAMRKYAFVAPDLANPHDSLGEVLMTQGRYEEAEAEFARAIAIQPDDFPWSPLNIAKIYLQRGQVAKALKILNDMRDVLARTGWERDLGLITITALFENGLYQELDERTRAFIAKFPDDDRTPTIRAMRLIHSGDFATYHALMDSMKVAWRENPYFAQFGNVRLDVEMAEKRLDGIAAAAEGDHAGAAARFREALEIGADAPPHRLFTPRYRLAEQLHALGQDDEALAQLDKILSVNPRITDALALAAEIHLGRGDRAATQRYLDMLERSLSLADPELPIVTRAHELRARFDSGGGA